uniref:Uncharacterized protein n=1 Tax=Trichogramma kaykai TaxID=54128 RepID=A0ABD2WSH4_9HYME
MLRHCSSTSSNEVPFGQMSNATATSTLFKHQKPQHKHKSKHLNHLQYHSTSHPIKYAATIPSVRPKDLTCTVCNYKFHLITGKGTRAFDFSFETRRFFVFEH